MCLGFTVFLGLQKLGQGEKMLDAAKSRRGGSRDTAAGAPAGRDTDSELSSIDETSESDEEGAPQKLGVGANVAAEAQPGLRYGLRAFYAGIVGVSLLGGFISSLTGSGIDICVFTFLIAVGFEESVAQPTSVICMAWVSVVGTLWKIANNNVEAKVRISNPYIPSTLNHNSNPNQT